MCASRQPCGIVVYPPPGPKKIEATAIIILFDNQVCVSHGYIPPSSYTGDTTHKCTRAATDARRRRAAALVRSSATRDPGSPASLLNAREPAA